MYQGNFSNWVNSKNQLLIPIYDTALTQANPDGTGFVRDPFPGNSIPTRFSSVSSQYLALAKSVLPPNRPGSCRDHRLYQQQLYFRRRDFGGVNNQIECQDRPQHPANHRISYFYNRASRLVQTGAAGPAGLPPVQHVLGFDYTADIHRGAYDWTVSPRMFNHFSFGVNALHKDTFSDNIGGNWKSKVCIVNAVDCNEHGPCRFSEFFDWGTSADNGTDQPRWALRDDFNYIRGSHALKFGGTYDHQEANGFGQEDISGLAGFSFLETAVPGATSATSGSSFASFSGQRGCGTDGDCSLREADFPLLRILRTGRLEGQPKTDVELRVRYDSLFRRCRERRDSDFAPLRRTRP